MATKMLFLRRFRGGKENIGEGSGGGGCTNVMHGRSRVTIDPRILTMPGRSMSGFHRPGKIGGGGAQRPVDTCSKTCRPFADEQLTYPSAVRRKNIALGTSLAIYFDRKGRESKPSFMFSS